MKSLITVVCLLVGAVVTGFADYFINQLGFFTSWVGVIGVAVGGFLVVKYLKEPIGWGYYFLACILNVFAFLVSEVYDVTNRVALHLRVDFSEALKLFPKSVDYFEEPMRIWMYMILGVVITFIGGIAVWRNLNEQAHYGEI